MGAASQKMVFLRLSLVCKYPRRLSPSAVRNITLSIVLGAVADAAARRDSSRYNTASIVRHSDILDAQDGSVGSVVSEAHVMKQVTCCVQVIYELSKRRPSLARREKY